jgi:uncharacterized protein with PIN domain
MQLLCDAMLGSTARWLRAAGYDAALAGPGEADVDLLARARREGRVLVTRDRRLIAEFEAKLAAIRWVLLDDDGDEAQALALAEALGVDWTHAPFTRCLMDNEPLKPAGAADLAQIPEPSRELPGPFRVCPRCGRVYWPGSHVRRMRGRLERWRALADGG